MQEEARTCARSWRKTLRPNWVRFLAIDASIVDCVCLPLKNLTFLPFMHPLCEFSWRKRKGKVRSMNLGFASIWVSGHHAALPHRYTLLYNTQKSRLIILEISPCRPVSHSEEIRRCILLFLCTLVHTQSLYATLLRGYSQLGENSSAGHVHVFTPFFQNTSFSLFDFILKGCCIKAGPPPPLIWVLCHFWLFCTLV